MYFTTFFCVKKQENMYIILEFTHRLELTFKLHLKKLDGYRIKVLQSFMWTQYYNTPHVS